jgi:hypothetical protein
LLSSTTFEDGKENWHFFGAQGIAPFLNMRKTATCLTGDPDSGCSCATKANGKEYTGHKLEAKDEEEPAKPKGRILVGKE